MWLSIIAVLGKFFDLLNPWSSFWAGRSKKSAENKDKSKTDMDESVKKGDHDAFLNARSDRHTA